MSWTYNDGGRENAGFKGSAGDCVVRAIAIATEQDYTAVYNDMNLFIKSLRQTKKAKKSASRTGIYKLMIKKYLTKLGWSWTPTMQIGSGCKVHLKGDELPDGRLIVSVTKHMVCVVDGKINDTYDCSRSGTRCVYGYWTKKTINN